ncbi:Fc.00g096190.m01.CDS01 [Cosmosporella sp. VM-42]
MPEPEVGAKPEEPESDLEDGEGSGDEADEPPSPTTEEPLPSQTSSVGGASSGSLGAVPPPLATETTVVQSSGRGSEPTGSILIPTTSFSTATKSSASPASDLASATRVPKEQLSRVASAISQTSLSTQVTESAGLGTGESEAIASGSSSSSGPKVTQAAAAGIALGVIAFLTLIVAGAFLLWRRRRSANSDHVFDRYPPEKHLPSTTDIGHDGHDARHIPVRTHSDIMNQAMTAVYAAEIGNHHGDRVSMESNLSRRLDHERRLEEPPEPVSPLTPTGERPPELRPISDSPQEPITWFEGPLYPPATAENLGIYPPGQVPIDQYRVPSMARTEVTATTESSWRTWNVNQANAQKPRTWKERYLT